MNADLRLAGLEWTSPEQLTIRRVRRGGGFRYVQANGRTLRDTKAIRRLERLAVPPAYRETVFATNPRSHIQAIGRDAAGRLQYRYHADWERVRELRKARRLAKLIDLLPVIRRAVTKQLKQKEINRDFTTAAVVELIARTAIRPGSEAYAREHGTRGAASLLKRNVSVHGDKITLRFRGKGSKQVEKQIQCRRIAKAIKQLGKIPGRRLFQYISEDGAVTRLRRRDANAFLREITNNQISLKDFRTFSACSQALEHLLRAETKPSPRGRRAHVKAALRKVANELANTPAVCRKSYVHTVVIEAFETGQLKRLAAVGRPKGSVTGDRLLQKILQGATTRVVASGSGLKR